MGEMADYYRDQWYADGCPMPRIAKQKQWPPQFTIAVQRVLGSKTPQEARKTFDALVGPTRHDVIRRARELVAANNPSPGKWKMADGTTVTIAEMTDGHLVNAIKILTAKRLARKWKSKNFTENEMRAEAAKRGIDLCEYPAVLDQLPPKFKRVGIRIVKVVDGEQPKRSTRRIPW